MDKEQLLDCHLQLPFHQRRQICPDVNMLENLGENVVFLA